LGTVGEGTTYTGGPVTSRVHTTTRMRRLPVGLMGWRTKPRFEQNVPTRRKLRLVPRFRLARKTDVDGRVCSSRIGLTNQQIVRFDTSCVGWWNGIEFRGLKSKHSDRAKLRTSQRRAFDGGTGLVHPGDGRGRGGGGGGGGGGMAQLFAIKEQMRVERQRSYDQRSGSAKTSEFDLTILLQIGSDPGSAGGLATRLADAQTTAIAKASTKRKKESAFTGSEEQGQEAASATPRYVPRRRQTSGTSEVARPRKVPAF